MLEPLVGTLITGATRLLTGAQARWLGCGPSDVQRVYFANHTSHADFALIWSVLPHPLRRKTRPVAAGDYWNRGALRKYLIHRVFRGVLVDRGHIARDRNPIATMCRALEEGSSLILFPEGTRGTGDQVQPFKAGVFHLAQAYSNVELVPAWIDNSYRVMPKGVPLPIPLLCSVAFGKPLHLEAGEHKPDFLDRLRQSLIETGNA
ncbi:MAG: lysophospholipid acyltransferase family protein [Bryobacteraceae bacterium]